MAGLAQPSTYSMDATAPPSIISMDAAAPPSTSIVAAPAPSTSPKAAPAPPSNSPTAGPAQPSNSPMAGPAQPSISSMPAPTPPSNSTMAVAGEAHKKRPGYELPRSGCKKKKKNLKIAAVQEEHAKRASPRVYSPKIVASSPGVNMLARSAALKRASLAVRHASAKRAKSADQLETPASQRTPLQNAPSLENLSPAARRTSYHGSKRRRRKLVSRIWEEAEPIYDSDEMLVEGRCIHCQQIFPATRDTGTRHIRRHLKNNRQEDPNIWMHKSKRAIQKLFDEYSREIPVNHQQQDCGSPHAEEDEEDDDPLAEWDHYITCKKGQATNELDQYLKEELYPLKKELDILEWWKINSPKYPVLSTIARDILAISASTVPSESAFSSGGRIVSDYRSSLSCSTVEALIGLQDWLRATDPQKYKGASLGPEEEE